MNPFKKRPAVAVAAIAIASALALSACTGGTNTAAPKTITLTYWSWDTFAPTLAKMYKASHPNVKIDVVNAGQELAEYTKLRTAIDANKGVPDIIDMEFPEMRTFEQTNSLLDLSKNGANSIADKFIPWVWGQVSAKNAVYGIPLATGQMGLVYRQDILNKYGIAVPKTYTEFAAAATKLHAADPSASLIDFAPNDYNQFMGLAWQAGAQPFKQTGTNSWQINLSSAPIQKLVNFWAPLIANGTIAVDPDFTTDWYRGMGSAKYASWPVGAWGPYFLTSVAKDTSGQWRAAELPQWTAGAHASGNEGGGATVGYAGTNYPKEVTSFLEYTVMNTQSAQFLAENQSRFPVTTAEVNRPQFINQKVPFYGGQQVNQVFAKIATGVNTSFQWAPFNDFVESSYYENVGKAFANKETNLLPALQAWQTAVVAYAQKQGFKVSVGG